MTWNVENVRRADGGDADETRWSYVIALRNRRSVPVEILQESVVLAYNRVYLSPAFTDERQPPAEGVGPAFTPPPPRGTGCGSAPIALGGAGKRREDRER
jgi:hypothetical protein